MHLKRTFRNIVLPGMILVPLLVLMVGCLYIPTFEQVDHSAADFRPLISDGNDHMPIAVGRITREQIKAILGRPGAESKSGRFLVYFMETKQGIWIEPQCFSVFWADQQIHTLGLQFDDHGTLLSVQANNHNYNKRVGGCEMYYMGEEYAEKLAKQNAITEFNRMNKAVDGWSWQSNGSPFYIDARMFNPR